jgi:hypothetical protein
VAGEASRESSEYTEGGCGGYRPLPKTGSLMCRPLYFPFVFRRPSPLAFGGSGCSLPALRLSPWGELCFRPYLSGMATPSLLRTVSRTRLGTFRSIAAVCQPLLSTFFPVSRPGLAIARRSGTGSVSGLPFAATRPRPYSTFISLFYLTNSRFGFPGALPSWRSVLSVLRSSARGGAQAHPGILGRLVSLLSRYICPQTPGHSHRGRPRPSFPTPRFLPGGTPAATGSAWVSVPVRSRQVKRGLLSRAPVPRRHGAPLSAPGRSRSTVPFGAVLSPGARLASIARQAHLPCDLFSRRVPGPGLSAPASSADPIRPHVAVMSDQCARGALRASPTVARFPVYPKIQSVPQRSLVRAVPWT